LRLPVTGGKQAMPGGRLDPVEVGFAAFLVALSGLFLWGARSIKPAIYDNLGSAALPVTAALLVIGLVGWSLWQAVQRRAEEPPAADAVAIHDRPGLGFGFLALTLGFAALLGSGLLGFALAGFLYLAASGLLLARKAGKTAVILLAIAACLGFGGQYLFTHFFYIALP
jgi:hypothetical protein